MLALVGLLESRGWSIFHTLHYKYYDINMENPIFVSYKRKVYLAVNSMRVLVMIQVSFVFICSIYINKFYFFPFATLNILLKKKIKKKKKKKKRIRHAQFFHFVTSEEGINCSFRVDHILKQEKRKIWLRIYHNSRKDSHNYP